MIPRPDLFVSLICLAIAVAAWWTLGVQVMRLAAQLSGGAS